MKLTNISKYDTSEINQLVRFATKSLRKQLTPRYWDTLTIRFTGTKREYKGRAFNSSPYHIIIRVGDPSHFPLLEAGYGWKYKTAPKYSLNTWQEAVVAIAAHESWHIRKYHKFSRNSEIDAEKHAVKILEKYRRTLNN